MHMQRGVGRTGYLLLAIILFLVGGLGLAVTVLAFEDGTALFVEIGVGLIVTGLVGLFGFAAWGPWLGQTPAPPRPLPVPEREAARAPARPDASPTRPTGSPTGPTAAPAGSASPGAQRDPGPTFEFDDPRPAARAAPTEMVMPDAFEPAPASARPASVQGGRGSTAGGPERDPAAWPQERGRHSAWAAQREREAELQQQVEDSPVRREMQERYTRNTPTIRGMLQQEEAPLKLAERAPPDVGPGFAAPGMSVGRCGRCKTALLAPDQRPLRLKCPECAKVTLLE